MIEDLGGGLSVEGSLVRLRDWRAGDVEAYRGWQQPGQAWQEWDGPYFPRPSEHEVDAGVEGLRGQVEAGVWPSPRERLVVANAGSDALVGVVSWYFESEVSNWRRIGIVLFDPASWSGGRGTQAVALWTDYLFAVTDVVRLDLATWSGNTGMCRVAEKLGWTREACFRQAREVRGCRYDSVVYGVLREEWTTR